MLESKKIKGGQEIIDGKEYNIQYCDYECSGSQRYNTGWIFKLLFKEEFNIFSFQPNADKIDLRNSDVRCDDLEMFQGSSHLTIKSPNKDN